MSAGDCLPAVLMQHLDLCDTLRVWRPEEIYTFEALLSAEYKDFDGIAQRLPGKSCADVVRFYYDVWKTQRLPQARRWYLRRQQASNHDIGLRSSSRPTEPSRHVSSSRPTRPASKQQKEKKAFKVSSCVNSVVMASVIFWCLVWLLKILQ